MGKSAFAELGAVSPCLEIIVTLSFAHLFFSPDSL